MNNLNNQHKSILFIALCDLYDQQNGITKKVIAQVNALKSINYNVTAISYYKEDIIVNDSVNYTSSKGNRRHKAFEMSLKLLDSQKYDMVYIRFPHLDFQLIKVLKIAHMKKCKVFMEIPTYPIKYNFFNYKNWIYFIGDMFFKCVLKYRISKIIYVGNKTNKIFGVNTEIIPNGFNGDHLNLTSNDINQTQDIEMVSITHFYKSHGYDRLILGLSEYYKLGNKRNIKIHLVGNGPTKDYLIRLVSKFNLKDNVLFYDSMKTDEVDVLFRSCNMGCAPLATHRIDISEASPLKTRDFFARGIPFIASYDEIGLVSNFKYILKVPADDSPINFKDVVNFFDSYINEINIVSREIRVLSMASFKWENIYSRIFEL